jgi:hypothetical protein
MDYFLNLRLGWLFRLHRSYLNSKKHYLAAERADPNALDPKLGLFYLFVENDMKEEALIIGRRILESHPKETEVANQLARLTEHSLRTR